jgi:hypothetical protein
MRKSIWIAVAVSLSAVPTEAAIISIRSVADGTGIDQPNFVTGTIRDGLFDQISDPSELNSQAIMAFNGNITEERGAVEFPIFQLAPSLRLTSATLYLQTVLRAQGPDIPVELRIDGYSGNGIIEKADFAVDNAIQMVGVSGALPFEKPLLAIDATSFINELLDANATHAGFGLRANFGVTFGVAGQTFGIPEWRPRLDLNVAPVPEPKSILHILAALTVFLVVLSFRAFKGSKVVDV